jgi:hypothetical protein
MLNGCENLVKDENHPIMKQLKSKKWDVVVVHLLDFCALGIAEMLQVKSTIWFSTAFLLDPIAWASGTPFEYSYVPNGLLSLDKT